MKKILLCFFVWFTAFQVKAQSELESPSSNWQVETTSSGNIWLMAKLPFAITAQSFFKVEAAMLGLGQDDSLHFLSKKIDEIWNVHEEYAQYYKGIPVNDTRLILHFNPNRELFLVNGYFLKDISVSTIPAIKMEDALKKAIDNSEVKDLAWNDKNYIKHWELDLNRKKEDLFPKGELIIAKLSNEVSLVWKFDIMSASGKSKCVFIDAHNNKILKISPLYQECVTGSTNNLNWYSSTTYTFKTTLLNGFYVLRENCNNVTGDVNTFKYSNQVAVNYGDIDSNWNTTSTSIRSGTTAHWCARKSLDFLKNEFSRNGYNGASANVNIYNEDNIDPNNARFSNGQIYFGTGNSSSNSDDYCTLDIVGHEIGHGVSNRLNYSGESGALNESFADIFGVGTERYALGTSRYNFQIGEERGILRDMTNPRNFQQPNTVNGQYWLNTSGCSPTMANDYCGVHTNSGVHNYWFYLLAAGGNGTNDNGYNYNVVGIQFTDALKIAYYSLTNYLVGTSTYGDARIGSLTAASALFGTSSQQYRSVAAAWCAVGMGGTTCASGGGQPCTYTISPNNQSFSSSQGSGSFVVTASSSSCSWTASANCNWVQLQNTTGTGSGSVNFSVQANTTTSSRTCTITVGGQTFTINQSGAASCSYSLNSNSQSFDANGGGGIINLNTGGGCSWTASADCNWVQVQNVSGTGNGNINFSVSTNATTSSRTCTITVGGQIFTITQSGQNAACTLVRPQISAAGCVLRVDDMGSVTYQWYLNGQTVGANSRFYTATSAGFYQCKVTSLTNPNCFKQSYDFQLLLINGICTVSTNNIDDTNSLKVYPNPSQGLFLIDIESIETGNLSIEVSNLLGQVIYQSKKEKVGNKFSAQIDLANAAKGVYLLNIKIGDKKVIRKLTIF
ncbi:MAG: hypothetical protein RL757_1042 [Bacteroidota bacterium]|jgi:Zn-dependent metalloprotease